MLTIFLEWIRKDPSAAYQRNEGEGSWDQEAESIIDEEVEVLRRNADGSIGEVELHAIDLRHTFEFYFSQGRREGLGYRQLALKNIFEAPKSPFIPQPSCLVQTPTSSSNNKAHTTICKLQSTIDEIIVDCATTSAGVTISQLVHAWKETRRSRRYGFGGKLQQANHW
jgi:hypothetical protein